MFKRLLLLSSLLVSVPGCALFQGGKEEPAPTAETQNFLGSISMVNEDGRFVLVDFGGFAAPQPGAEVEVRRDGETVATLKVGEEMRRPFAAADIVDGTPQTGDDVWSKKPTL
jgi:hypothetical protein